MKFLKNFLLQKKICFNSDVDILFEIMMHITFMNGKGNGYEIFQR